MELFVKNKSLPRRFLALWFPYLSAERVMRQRLGRSWRLLKTPNPPIVFSRRESNTLRVAAIDAQAESLKLRTGLGIAEARAMHPSIEVLEEDNDADRQLLEALANWCDRYTPLVSLEGHNGLFLDISGCAHLFGGEQEMLTDALRRYDSQGFDARAAIASTPGVSWAAARYASGSIVDPGKESEFLSPLPLAALRLEETTCQGLESVGLRVVGAVMSAPRAPLALRFGKSVAFRLEQALGAVEEAISPLQSPPLLSAERRFFEPISLVSDIENLIPLLALQLKAELERRQEGARRLELQLFRVDNHISRIAITSSRAVREPRLIGLLFREKLVSAQDAINPGYGFDLVRLAVLAASPFIAEQARLDGGNTNTTGDLSLFADRVRARLGDRAISIPRVVASHLPERAAAFDPFTLKDPRQDGGPTGPVRPLRLLQAELIDVSAAEIPEGPPGRFRWRNVSYRVVGAEGPERISPEWWRDPRPIGKDEEGEEKRPQKAKSPEKVKTAERKTAPPFEVMHARSLAEVRDYFRVEDDTGRRYWLYREGGYGDSQIPPRWYMQGLFA